MKHSLTRAWYGQAITLLVILLLPFSWIFAACVAMRRWLYRNGLCKTYHFNVPVIVVGNLTVGGTGKTPFVIWLAKFLQAQGYHPGIVSRGVGGKKQITPHRVTVDDSASNVGDEALLLAQNTQCPVVIAIDRVAAVRQLLKTCDCNIVISDDGLQHYRMGRTLEVVMVDGERRFGNNRLLPAGPLREPRSRLRSVDFVVVNSEESVDTYTMSLQPTEFISVVNSQYKMTLQEFPRDNLHAVAGIGNPQRFFMSLKQAGFNFIPHTFPDHHAYQPQDLMFTDTLPIVMTEKDAVKCVSFADQRYWYLNVSVKVNHKLEQALIQKIKSLEDKDNEKDFTLPACKHAYSLQHDNIRQEN